jgi:uncharacterized protein with HEPN domain
MYDKELALEILTQIYQATQTVLNRFETINSADDFTSSDSGMEKLDAICMQLIAIGEGLKNLDKTTNNTLLTQYPQIEWKKVKGMRDIISHHYFDLDAEAIYEVCKNHIDTLALTLEKMIKDL